MTTRDEFIAGLRELATFLDEHPAVPAPLYGAKFHVFPTVNELRALATVATWEKDYHADYFSLSRVFGSGALALSLTVDRDQVCKRVVTGTQTIPARPEQTIETVEWVCEDASLLAGATRE